MISVHNVPYVLKCINDILPRHESRSYIESCSASQFVCISHLLCKSDLFHKKAGTRTGQTGSGSGHREILTRAAPTYDIYWWQPRTIEFCDIPDMNHIGEAQLGHLDRKGFNFACPHRSDAISHRRQRKAADPIE